MLIGMNDESCGDVIEAYMAAADAAKKLNDHMGSLGQPGTPVPWRREYKDLVGGCYNETDEVSDYIHKWVIELFNKQGPVPLSKNERKRKDLQY